MAVSLARPLATDDFILAQATPIISTWQSSLRTERRKHGPVTHSYAALAFFTSGHARIEQDVAWQVAPGDVVLIPAGQPHRFLESQRAGYWGIGFCAPCFADTGATALLDPIEKVRDGASAVVHIPAARQTFLEQLFRELAESGEKPVRDRAALAAVQRSLLTLILNEVDSAALPPALSSGAAPSVVLESLRYIERNCLRALTLNEVAVAVGRSPAYVTSALSRATGRSAVEWIVSIRMAEARRLLLHSDEHVDVIAERVGYADATHFIRMFRRAHGATPAAWRASR
jgi:AraC family transcriptional regulator, transcriptional activator of pobA